MDSQPHIFSFPISDNQNPTFLVRVSQKGDQLLDLELLATDSESVFRSEILQSRLSPPAKVEFGHEAWISILSYVFCRQAVPDEHATAAKGLVVEAVVKNNQAEVKISRNIQGIQVRKYTKTLRSTA